MNIVEALTSLVMFMPRCFLEGIMNGIVFLALFFGST
jgi:hypothetical protein